MTALSRLYETERDLRESERGLRCVSETAVRVTERDDSESQMYMMCPLFATKTQMSEGSVALAPKKLGRPLPDYDGRGWSTEALRGCAGKVTRAHCCTPLLSGLLRNTE